MTESVKTVYALWDDTSVKSALLPHFRRRLRSAGAARVQINVDDDDVAQAQLRTVNGSSPIRAVVSVWAAPTDTSAVVGAVRTLDPQAAGWLVEERLPIRPPHVPDGERTPALANVAFLRSPEELDRESWLERWIGQHTSVAIETQGTFGYVQNVVTASVTDAAPPVSGIVEELFPMVAMSDWHAFYGTDGSQEELDEIRREVEGVVAEERAKLAS
jgi:hypothetical protein